jgi:hypothetical protein
MPVILISLIDPPAVNEQREGWPAWFHAHLNSEIVGRLSFNGNITVVVGAVTVMLEARAGVVREFVAAALRAERDVVVIQAGSGRAPRNNTPEIVALNNLVAQAALHSLQDFLLVFKIVVYEAEQEAFQHNAQVI